MSYILEKYRKYNLEYDVKDKILFIFKDIPVETWLELKVDIAKSGIRLNDIRIYGR